MRQLRWTNLQDDVVLIVFGIKLREDSGNTVRVMMDETAQTRAGDPERVFFLSHSFFFLVKRP